MPVIRFNGSTNYNASDIARRAQGRTVFANSLVNQKTLEKSCLNRVVSGPAAATSFDASKYINQRVGTIFTTPAEQALILTASPCKTPTIEPEVYPNYLLTCNDSVGIQIMASGPFTRFTFTTTSQGAGVIEFQFFLLGEYQSSQLVVLGVDSNLITPPRGIDEVRYVFRCNPFPVTLSCVAGSKVLQWTIPYSFTYLSDLSGATTQLTLYPHNGGSPITQTVTNGGTYVPTPAWGYDLWDMDGCEVGSLLFDGNSYLSTDGSYAAGLNLGSGNFTIEWYQYYDSSTINTYPALFNYKTSGSAYIVGISYNNSTDKITYFESGGASISLDITSYKDVWCHIAVCRSSGVVYIYKNGVSLGNVNSTTNFSDGTNNLFIGNDLSASGLGYKGKITNFRILIGTALYPLGDTFTPPPTPLTNLIGTQLLLDAFNPMRATDDSSSIVRPVTVNGDIQWSSDYPV